MASFTKVTIGSGGSSLVPLATNSSVTVHSTLSNATTIDEIWLWAKNTGTVDHELRISTSADPFNMTNEESIISVVIPSKSIFLVMPGIPITGTTGQARLVSAYSPTANATPKQVSVFGYVNRITP